MHSKEHRSVDIGQLMDVKTYKYVGKSNASVTFPFTEKILLLTWCR